MRYDFMNDPPTDLLQDRKRPSARFGAGMAFVFTDIHFTPETRQTFCKPVVGCYTTIYNPIYQYTDTPEGRKGYSRLTNIDRVHQKRIHPYGSTEKACIWSSATWRDEYIKPAYGGWDYTAPPGCRPQLVMFSGYDVNDYYMMDLWFYDIWNNSWSTSVPAPFNYTKGPPSNPVPRRFPSVNVFRADKPFRPRGAPSHINVWEPNCPPTPGLPCTCTPPLEQCLNIDGVPQQRCCQKVTNFTEMIYVMGGEADFPIGPFQDVWGYSREYNQWFDLKPLGRVPSARVYDTINFARDTKLNGGSGVITGYVIGGTFGGFKVDVMKYNCITNRFSSLYAEGAKPSARSYFATMLYKDTIFMHGGRGWVTVDNIDKEDLWSYNITLNRWFQNEPTGILPLGRQGHTAINLGTTMFIFAGYSEPSLQEKGTGDMNDVWRFDIELGALLADNKFLENAGGWGIFQNEVKDDTFTPLHCEDYASRYGAYWGAPCRIAWEGSTQQLLFVDGLHNDTYNEQCSLLGCNGVGYLSAPKNYVRIGKKMYQGRLRYRYTKVYPSADNALQYEKVCDALFLNSTSNPTINPKNTLLCGDLMYLTNGSLSEEESCPQRIEFFACVKRKGCMDLARNFLCTTVVKTCNIDAGVLCAPRRDAAFDTKDDLLLVGKYQVLSFDILNELVPYPNKFTLVDVDLDEQKGWRLHGTNGTIIPTREEFVDVLSTLQMILVRCDYWESIRFRDSTNLDYLGLEINEPTPELYFNNDFEGRTHNATYKLAQDGSLHPYGEKNERVGTEASGWTGQGLWKFMAQQNAGEPIVPQGRTETHGEIVGLKEIELFEGADPMFA